MVRPVPVAAWIALALLTIASIPWRTEASHEGRSSRRRRQLVFPKGSSFTITFAAGAYMDFNLPSVSAVTLELTAAYGLPSTRLKFPLNHPNSMTHAEENHSHNHFDLQSHSEENHVHVRKHQQESNHNEPLPRSSFRGNSWDDKELMKTPMYKNATNSYKSDHFETVSKFKTFENTQKTRFRRYVNDRLYFQQEVASLLNMRGINGEACITRARCEIAQTKGDQPLNLLQAFMRLVFMRLTSKDVPANEADFFKQCETAANLCPFSLLETHMTSRW